MINHILNKIPENQLDKKTQKMLFLKNFIQFIKLYILKCNYILSLEYSEKGLPFIKDINNLELQKNYLKNINELCPYDENKINDIYNNKNINNNINDRKDKKEIKIDGNLIFSLENMFKIKKLHISDDIINIDDSYDNILKEKYEINDKNAIIKNKLLYFINIVTKENENIDKYRNNEIKNKLSNALEIDKNNIFILFNEKLNNFAKSKEYFELKYNEIQIKNPILNKLNEIKLLINNLLCNECKIPKKYFDCRGNTLYPNSSFNIIRGTKLYDPPYGYIGIGLNVIGKYDNGNDDWLNNNYSGWVGNSLS